MVFESRIGPMYGMQCGCGLFFGGVGERVLDFRD